jgi:2-polyprenyl-3-methyl-5-hydroxy-6-metoxy-1,4-benzoquinol methylase
VSEHDDAAMFTQEFWDERYAGSTRVWSGKPNQRLVEQVTGLEPGTALDVGCGEGADVVWLAQQGWLATGVDVSQVAVDRAARHAEESGVGATTSFARVDVVGGAALPGSYDLVLAAFLHPPLPTFASTFTTVMAAVRPGGRLLVVAHHPADAGTGLRNPALAHLLFTPEQVVALLGPDEWEVEVSGTPQREVTTADGAQVMVTDTVVRALRR